MIDIIKNLGIHAGFAQLLISSSAGSYHSALLQGDATPTTNVIEVFQRGSTYSTVGGDVFFVGPWDSPVEGDVCALPPRGGLIGGVFALGFRMTLSLTLAPVLGFLMLPQALSVFWNDLVVGAFQRNIGLGLLAVFPPGSPLL